MNKKVLIISSSPRKGGNSETLAAAFAKGAREAGHQIETVYLREKQVGFCKGCLACLNLGHCVIQDDAVEIAAKMHDANVLVFATPVYYYCVSGQLKTMLDRANPLFDTDYAFTKAYLLAAAAEDAPETFAGTEKAVQGWVDCFPHCALAYQQIENQNKDKNPSRDNNRTVTNSDCFAYASTTSGILPCKSVRLSSFWIDR